jgi:glycosyltransferase involved in cell wall biosynthesis
LKKIGIVIPTRNRRTELERVLTCIKNQNTRIDEIIVVDSSNDYVPLPEWTHPDTKFSHIHTHIRSAAEQRNIGKRLIDNKVEYLAFLDDDVLVEHDYVSRLVENLVLSEAVGVSGVALNRQLSQRRMKPSGFVGLARRIFLLDSNRDGVLLLSGVNIPVRSDIDERIEVDWLIGCSMWRIGLISQLEFESDFQGQSLGEDVIFSVRARKIGKLITNPSIVINHYESPIDRPEKLVHFQEWVENRRRLISVMGGGIARRSAFQFANLGQALIFTFLGFAGGKINFRIALKIILTSIRNI